MGTRECIRLLIADDHALFRKALIALFEKFSQGEFIVVGEAANGEEAVRQAGIVKPDIILIDVEMPLMDGIAATALIKEAYPLIGVLALSTYLESSIVIDMVRAGADGYILKTASAEELRQAIVTVSGGDSYFTPATVPYLKQKIMEERGSSPRRIQLTDRETEILQLLCSGYSSKEVAAALQLSKRTIDSYREKINQKTSARNVIGLVRYAVKNRLYKFADKTCCL